MHGISRIIAKMFVSDADSDNQTCYDDLYAYCFAIKKKNSCDTTLASGLFGILY